MPVYNNAKYLRACIDSILSQTYDDFEFIILDDASTEPVWDIINSYEDPRIVKIRNEENIGLTKSLNICLDKAKGRLIARQDSDDISCSERFKKEVELFEDGVGLVSTWAKTVNEDYPLVKGSIGDPYIDKDIRIPNDKIKRVLRKQNCIMGPTAIYTKEVFEKIGYYDEELYFAQDYNYWLRLAQFFDIKVIPEVLYLRRKNSKSVRRDKRNDDKKVNIIERVHSRAISNTVIK